MEEEIKTCDRCYCKAYELYEHSYISEYDGEKKVMMLCWDCDWEIINGRGDYEDDAGEIAIDREEQDYYDDPINNPKPKWLP